MRLATACLLLLSTTNNNPVALVNGFQFNPLTHISTRNTKTQNVGTPQISSTPTTTTTVTTSSQPNTITSSTALSAKNESGGGFGKKKGRPKPPPRRSPTKDIKKAMAANDLVRFVLYCCIV